MYGLAALALALVLAADGASAACALAHQHPMLEAELFFGRDIAGRGTVSDDEWERFSASTIAAEFPDGFTVADAAGNWRDPKSGSLVREGSKIVLIVAPNSRALPRKLARIMDAYRRTFHQQSVGIVTREVCAAF